MTPRSTRALRITPVFQEVFTIGTRSVLDNVWLGAAIIVVVSFYGRETQIRNRI